MNRNWMYRVLQFAGITAIVLALTVLPALAGKVGAVSMYSTPALKGYVDHAYNGFVKDEPTADGAESKLWFNDGLWWGILYNPDTNLYEIYRLDWGTQTWNTTGLAVDSRQELAGGVYSGTVDTRADVLWDEAGEHLYIASHIKVDNPSRVNSEENWGKLFRYSYNSASQTYDLDANFPVNVNKDKTETLVLDKDSEGRLWVTYITRVPDGDPLVPDPYKVMINTSAVGNDLLWGTPIDMSTVTPNAVVDMIDMSSIVAYNSKVGLLWSNSLTGKFYFAEHAVGASLNSWDVDEVAVPGVVLTANDHMKLVANADDQVFAAIKTDNMGAGEPLVGVLARETDGTFSFATFSDVGSIDTRPTMVLNESNDTLYVFVTSNEVGGLICYKPLKITPNLADMAFAPGSCSDSEVGSAPHFISDAVYNKIDNSTSTKQNVTTDTGIVVIASDDPNGGRYLHNVIGGPLPTVTFFTPAQDAVVNGAGFTATARFSTPMDPSTITVNTFKVSGPGGPIAGTVSYDASTQTAAFVSSGTFTDPMTVDVQVTTGVKDESGRALAAAKSWSFTFDPTIQAITYTLFMPFAVK